MCAAVDRALREASGKGQPAYEKIRRGLGALAHAASPCGPLGYCTTPYDPGCHITHLCDPGCHPLWPERLQPHVPEAATPYDPGAAWRSSRC